MAEYIERDALLKKAIKEQRFVFWKDDVINNERVVLTCYKDLADVVRSIPAADVVPVVRCKDCAFCENKGMSGLYCNHPDNRNPYGCRGNDFCDAGRKRKDEDLGWGIKVE